MNIKIRSTEAGDAARYLTIACQQSVQENTLAMPCESLNDWNERLAGNGRDGIYHFAAEADGELAGIITVRNPQHPRLRHTTNLGMFVDEKHTGKGVGSALIEFALRYSFHWLGAVKVELEVFTDNQPAIGLYKKYGFREEGVRTKSALRNGQYVDVLMMGLEVQEAGGLPVSGHE
mgnify:CR=1 FL=1